MTTREQLEEVAARHLDPEAAAAWLSTLKPGVKLMHASPGHEFSNQRALMRLGGQPTLPAELPWPSWEGHGPLGFVGELYLDALAESGFTTGLKLPSRGSLQAFYYDGSYDNFESVVGYWDPQSSKRGAALLHVENGEARQTPEQVLEYAETLLYAQSTWTYPDMSHPAFKALVAELGGGVEHPLESMEFWEELEGLSEGPLHQMGGWVAPIQGAVEIEVSSAYLGLDLAANIEPITKDSANWENPLQIDSDGPMMWGDAGMLHWLGRRGSGLSTDDVWFTWQSC